MTLPIYTAPTLPGYLWWTNSSKYEDKSNIEYDIPFLVKKAAAKFDIPEDDIWVVPFNPTGDDHQYTIHWATYIKDIHATMLNKRKAELEMMMEALSKLGE